MHARLPTIALLLGIVGLIPFIGCAIATVSAGTPDQTSRGLLALIAYGAVILAFVGGVHWGFALRPMPEGVVLTERHGQARLVLGVIPVLVGWLALLAPLGGVADLGLVVLIVGFLAAVLTEGQLKRRGLMPGGYMLLRWALTIVVLMILITVLTLRLIGATITI
ncbi:MAG TPA: DUF3429 domain-containing protein [Acetobacteraceae bacterium]|jgi:hypothetical protein|nr:DUF3429 domain-containing protein [Acetobacteraceae bacterium]